mgnify:CR=1 FL=1
MEKLDCMGNYYGTSYGKLQVLYLKEKVKLSIDEISRITSYAYSTVKNYLNKYWHLLDEALDLFFYKNRKIIKKDSCLKWECECPEDGIPCAYVTEIYGKNERLFLKIGYSAHMRDRMYAHATNKRYGSDFVVIKSVYTFNNEEINSNVQSKNFIEIEESDKKR